MLWVTWVRAANTRRPLTKHGTNATWTDSLQAVMRQCVGIADDLVGWWLPFYGYLRSAFIGYLCLTRSFVSCSNRLTSVNIALDLSSGPYK
jgi:hypothetical protein